MSGNEASAEGNVLPGEQSDASTKNDTDNEHTMKSTAQAAAPATASTEASPAMGEGQQAQVPLYATEQPAPVDNPQGGQPLWGTGGNQRYVQVPRERQPERSVIRKTGPSAATIVLAAFMLFFGVLVAAIALRFPNPVFPAMWINPAIIVASACAALGGILVFVAVAWAIAKGVHGIVGHGRSEKEVDHAPDEPVGQDSRAGHGHLEADGDDDAPTQVIR